MSLNSRSFRPLPRRAILALLCVAGLTTGYIWWSYSIPYRWLVDLQLHTAGVYWPQLTVFAVFFIVSCLLAVPARLVLHVVGEMSTAAGDDRVGTQESADDSARWENRWIALVGGGSLIALGAVLYASGQSAGGVSRVTAREVEQGGRPKGNYLEIEGQLLASERQSQKVSRTSTAGEVYHYVPLKSRNWQPGQPVGVFVEFTSRRFREVEGRLDTMNSIRGLVAWMGLPGPIRTGFEQRGLPPTENYILLKYGQTPSLDIDRGRTLLILGSIIVAVRVAYDVFRRLLR